MRGEGSNAQVLLGRRAPRQRFMPDVYVFPGGSVDPGDARSTPVRALPRRVAAPLEDRWSAPRVRALATAAVRETHEETGLLFGRLEGDGLRPDHSRLTYLGRAITPTDSHLRFHARFFLARAEEARGSLVGNGELLDLRFVELGRARQLPMIDVTAAMLRELEERLAHRSRGALFVHYRRGLRLLDRE